MRRFFWKFLILFLLQNNLDFAESISTVKGGDYDSVNDLSSLANKYFENRQLTLKEDEERFVQTHFNYFSLLDLFFARGDFDPLPEKWYEYSNIIKRNNKRRAIVSFIPRLVSFFTEFNKPFGNILPSTTIRDINILNKNSPFDKLVSELVSIADAREDGTKPNVDDISFNNLCFLFRLLNAYNKREDIDDVIRNNEALLSDRDTMLELFDILKNFREDEDFLLHFNDTINFLQQCGLHKGEYECYNFGQLVYNDTKEGEWNGWLLNNLEVSKEFDFNGIPFFTEGKEYPFSVILNPVHIIFVLLSKILGKPGILEFVDSWRIDSFLFFIILKILLGFFTSGTFSVILKIFLFFYKFTFSKFIDAFISKRFHIKIRVVRYIRYIFLIIFDLYQCGVENLKKIKDPLIKLWRSFKDLVFNVLEENKDFFPKIVNWFKNDVLKKIVILLLVLLWIFLVNLFIYLCFVSPVLVPCVYKKRLGNILFSKDILRIRRYVRNMRDFYLKIRDKNENIKSLFIKYLPQCSSLFDVDISENTSLNDEQKELFNLIFSDKVIKGMGELARFYYLFYKYLEMFAKIIVEIQYVGSYVNAAMLVNSGKFCIPKFRHSGENYIKMQDVVHPYLVNGGVRNSFEIGEKETGIRNMIFSGSNGTGKTTFQFAVVDNVILAQSLGIACCSEYLATPFDKIISMSNAKTDLSEGLSGYTSEVEMVKDCLSYLSENKDKRILLISDEPLSTTDPDFADWIVGLIFRSIFSYSNVTSIVATHFKSPKKIPGRDKHLHAGNFRFKIVDNGTSLENLHLLEHGEGDNLGRIIAKQRGLLDLIDINE